MTSFLSKYFTKSNSVEWGGCNAGSSDTIRMESLWSITTAGSYKVEHKLRLPTGAVFSFFTPLEYFTSGTKSLITAAFIKPIPAGTYVFVFAVLYDSAGTTIASG